MNVGNLAFGVLETIVGSSAAFFAIRSGQIVMLSINGFRPIIFRETAPRIFWAAVAFYGFIATLGLVEITKSV